MPPKPTVVKTVTVRYRPSVRFRGSVEASACAASTMQ
jgi:hypothetical protein